MDWDTLLTYETIPGRAISKGVNWELNELMNGDGKKNSSETNYLKTAVCRIVAASLGLASITQMREEDIKPAREKAEAILGWIRAAKAER